MNIVELKKEWLEYEDEDIKADATDPYRLYGDSGVKKGEKGRYLLLIKEKRNDRSHYLRLVKEEGGWLFYPFYKIKKESDGIDLSDFTIRLKKHLEKKIKREKKNRLRYLTEGSTFSMSDDLKDYKGGIKKRNEIKKRRKKLSYVYLSLLLFSSLLFLYLTIVNDSRYAISAGFNLLLFLHLYLSTKFKLKYR